MIPLRSHTRRISSFWLVADRDVVIPSEASNVLLANRDQHLTQLLLLRIVAHRLDLRRQLRQAWGADEPLRRRSYSASTMHTLSNGDAGSIECAGLTGTRWRNTTFKIDAI